MFQQTWLHSSAINQSYSTLCVETELVVAVWKHPITRHELVKSCWEHLPAEQQYMMYITPENTYQAPQSNKHMVCFAARRVLLIYFNRANTFLALSRWYRHLKARKSFTLDVKWYEVTFFLALDQKRFCGVWYWYWGRILDVGSGYHHFCCMCTCSKMSSTCI